jgi:hypothetical protein
MDVKCADAISWSAPLKLQHTVSNRAEVGLMGGDVDAMRCRDALAQPIGAHSLSSWGRAVVLHSAA